MLLGVPTNNNTGFFSSLEAKLMKYVRNQSSFENELLNTRLQYIFSTSNKRFHDIKRNSFKGAVETEETNLIFYNCLYTRGKRKKISTVD